MTRRSDVTVLPTTYKIHDFNTVALADDRLVKRGALQDRKVVLDRDATRVNRQRLQQRCHRQRFRDVVTIAVQRDGHGLRARPLVLLLSGTGRSSYRTSCQDGFWIRIKP